MHGRTAFEPDASLPSGAQQGVGRQLLSSPYLTPILEAHARKVASMIHLEEVNVPPTRCMGPVTLSHDPDPPNALTVTSEDGTTLYFTPVCVIDLETNEPLCALYCLNIHRVFMRDDDDSIVDLSPTALEVLGGRASNRKWRVSLKVIEVKEGELIIRMGLGKWLDRTGLDSWLPEEATSRVGSKQSSRDPTPVGSPGKRPRAIKGRGGPSNRAAEHMDAVVDAFSRQARVISSGEVLWRFSVQAEEKEQGRIASDMGRARQTPRMGCIDLCRGAQYPSTNCEGGTRKDQDDNQDDAESDALVFLPTLLPHNTT